MSIPIGTLGNIDVLQIGSSDYGYQTFVDMDNLITIGAGMGGNGFSTLRLPNGTAGYPVTTGKTLKLRAMSIREPNASNKIVQIGYGNTDVGFNSVSAPTTPVYCFGDSYASGGVSQLVVTTANIKSAPIRFDVLATKYPFAESTGGCAVSAYGYEV